ncbi:single-stranded DNA-binding protein [Jeotgalibaca dankookensis]|uniref:single-stranded DNA-binding protein n=1 Tax=Jeotgalibaca dankookensis TaxID=708126 RepID=UPI000780DC0C|nr:single-stranded DNA-binding protein [Jeotgalibaca dankookensis]
MINNACLTGRLTRDCDLKYTGNGNAVASFSLAVNRSYKREGEPEADFINCVVWNKTAEALANYTKKGSLIGVTGRIQSRNYENQQGQRVYVTEIICSQIAFLETQKTSAGGTLSNSQINTQENISSQIYPGNSGQKSSYGQGIDISDDDIPF